MLSINGLWIAQSKFDLGLNRSEFTLTVSPNICRIGVPVPAFAIEILCSENGGESSPIVYSVPSRTIDYFRVDSTIGYTGTTTISRVIELKSSILVSASRGSFTFSMS